MKRQTDQRAAKDPIFLFGRDRIFPSRPCGFRPHGAQGRVKAGRLFSGRPQGLALTGRAPCYALQEAVPILGMVLCTSLTFLRQRSSPVRAETRAFRAGGARSRGQCSPRDRARSSPLRRGAAQSMANTRSPCRSPASRPTWSTNDFRRNVPSGKRSLGGFLLDRRSTCEGAAPIDTRSAAWTSQPARGRQERRSRRDICGTFWRLTVRPWNQQGREGRRAGLRQPFHLAPRPIIVSATGQAAGISSFRQFSSVSPWGKGLGDISYGPQGRPPSPPGR